MAWPLISDFSRMLQNPRVAFHDPALHKCTIEMDNLGQPRPRSGNFATVYRAYREDGSEFAVRVFNRQADLRRDAYQEKSEYVKQCHVASLVGFNYDEKGIRASDGKLYPLLIMDWVPGITLFEWVQDRCREGYQEALEIAADVWLHLVRELLDHDIVHGDLQHGNVMVASDGHIKLVDYDCMAVPALMGQPNFEIGLEPYQHPQRDARTEMFPGLDNYSAIVIYVALRALAAAPQLWTAYVENTGYDKLLFRKEDFANPQASSLYAELMNSPDSQVCDLAYYLFQLAGYELKDIPTVDEVILWTHSIEDLLSQGDWDRAVELAERMGPNEEVPEEVQPQLAKAYRRVECRRALEDALQMGSEWEVQQLYDPELLDDYPGAETLVEDAKRSGEVIRLLETLNTAKRFKRWDVFRETWEKNHDLLNRRPSARAYREEIKRIRAAHTVRRLLESRSAGDHEIIEAWKYFKSLGMHESGADLEPLVAERARRHNELTRLRRRLDNLPDTPSEATDRQLAQAWKAANLDGWDRAGEIAAPYRAAVRRLQCIERIREIVKSDVTLEGETEFAKLAVEIPESYHPNLGERLRQAKRRLKAHRALRKALRPPRSDLAIVVAYKKMAAANGKKMISDKVRDRIILARRRAPILRALSELADDTPANEVDERLLKVWDEKLLAKCHDAEKWRARYKLAQTRRRLLDKVAAAIENADQARLAELADEPCLKHYPLPEKLREGLKSVQARVVEARQQHRQSLIKSLRGNQRSEFTQLFDVAMVRDICAELPHHQTLAGKWTEEQILPLDGCGLAVGAEGGLKPMDEGRMRAVWTWPESRITEQCRLVVCHEQPKATAIPDDVPALLAATIDQQSWLAGGEGYQVIVRPEWENAFVYVWAVVDLGFQVFYSPPLEVGQFKSDKKSKKWGLFK